VAVVSMPLSQLLWSVLQPSKSKIVYIYKNKIKLVSYFQYIIIFGNILFVHLNKGPRE